MKKLFFLFLFFNLCIRFGYAQAWYVDARNTTPPYLGTFEDPWPSFSWVCCSTSVSGTVNVAPGLYAGPDNLIILNDRSNLIIKFDADPTPPENGPEVILDGNFDYEYGVTITSSSNITIQGLRIQKFKYNGIKISGTTITPMNSFNINIIGCKVENTMGATSGSTSFAGIFVERTKNCLIQNCTIKQIHLINPNPVQTEGIYAQACKDLIITKNYIYLDHQIETIPESQPHIDGVQVTWEKPDYSNGVEISSNIIINLGKNTVQPPPNNHYRSGIALARTNGNILIKNNNIVVPYGKDLINSQFYKNTENLKIYNNTLVSTENPTTLMEISNGGDPKDPNDPPDPGYPDRVRIKNNIFVKKGTGNRPALIIFNRIDPLEINTEIIDYNLYYYYNGSTFYTVGLYFSKDQSMRDWNYYDINNAKGIVGLDPLFVSTASSDYKYNILNSSPAKNFGLPLEDVVDDILGIKRPYWFKGVDLGAFEIPEAQLRIGLAQNQGDVTHTIQAIGTYWEKTEGLASWPISTDQNIELNTYSSTYDADKENWNGFHLKWMRPNINEKPMGHAFYKLTNNHSDAFIYIDLRDAVTNYNPNIYIRYDQSSSQYSYWDGDAFVDIIENGKILRVWQIGNNGSGGTPNTEDLNNFWINSLVQIEDDNDHPKFVWGPYPGNAPISQYKLYRSGNYPVGNRPDPPYPTLVTVSNQVYDYIDASVTISGNINMRSYYLTGRTGGIELETPLTNIADVYLLRQSKTSSELADNKYELRQNYPNPFNPQTTISFSIAEQSRVYLKIYDIIGREVKTLVNDNLEPGNYNLDFNAADLSSGIYFCRLSAGKYSETKKLQLIK